MNPIEAGAGVLDVIRQRWSPRAFAGTPVPAQDIDTLLEAARWASSSMNEQPWAFIVGDRSRDAAAHARIAATLVPGNIVWAERAPLLVVIVARLGFARNGRPNRHAFYDTGQAVAQLALQATALGLVVHQMGGFSPEAARETLGIPEGCEAVAVMAVGYPGDPATLSEELRARETAPRRRKGLEEWAFRGTWGALWARKD